MREKTKPVSPEEQNRQTKVRFHELGKSALGEAFIAAAALKSNALLESPILSDLAEYYSQPIKSSK